MTIPDKPESANSFFVTGGTVPPDSASYIRRHADDDLLEGLLAGEFCYVLNTRQMGKSSLCVHAIAGLHEKGVRTVFIDLTRIGAHNLSAEQWYAGLLKVTGSALGQSAAFVAYWKSNADQSPVARFFGALRDVAVAPTDDKIIVFIDEIDAVRSLPFSTDEFFAAVRGCYNARTLDPVLKRLTFCLIGVAAPTDLIADPRISPFNIGRRIWLTDFSYGETAPLAAHLPGGELTLQRIVHWTGGHPYLTQRLCRAAVDGGCRSPVEIDNLCGDLFLSHSARESDDNLAFVRNLLLRNGGDVAALLDLYRKTLVSRGNQRVRDDETDPLHTTLRLSGICRAVGDYLRVRNRIYERVFDEAWIQASMPGAELRRQREAFRRGVRRTAALAGAVTVLFASLAFFALAKAREASENADEAEKNFFRAQRETKFASDTGRELRVSLEKTRDQKRHADEMTKSALESAHSAQREKTRALAESVKADRAVIAERSATARAKQAASDARLAEEAAKSARNQAESARRFADSKRRESEASLVTAQQAQAEATRLALANKDLADGKAEEANRAREAATAAQKSQAEAEAQARLATERAEQLDVAAEEARHRLYASNLQLLQIAWNGNSMTQVGKLLQETGRDRQHGFEWDYWNHLYNAPRTVFICGGPVNQARFSLDGNQIITTNSAGGVYLWDRATGQQRGDFTPLPASAAAGIEAALSRDGRRLVVANSDGSASVWDTATNRRLSSIPSARGGTAHVGLGVVGYAPGGLGFALAGGAGTVRQFDADGTHEMRALRDENRATVTKIAYSSDGQLLLTATSDDVADLWDVPRGTLLRQLGCQSRLNHMAAVALSADGRRIALQETGRDASTTISILPVAGGGWPISTIRRDGTPVTSLCLSPDGARLATGEASGLVTIWDANSGRQLSTIQRHQRAVRSVAFSPDGEELLTGDDNGLALLWSAHGPQTPTVLAHGPEAGAVHEIVETPDGRVITAASKLNGGPREDIVLWNVTAIPAMSVVNLSRSGRLSGSTASGDRLISIDGANAIVWNARTYERIASLPAERPIRRAALSPDGVLAATLDTSGKVILWDVLSAGARGTVTLPAGDADLWFAPSNAGRSNPADVGANDLCILSWDVSRRGSAILHRWKIREATESPNRLTSPVSTLPFGPVARPIAVSPDGLHLCAALEEGGSGMAVWNLSAEPGTAPSRQSLSDYPGHALTACFSPDGARVAAAGEDGDVYLWDIVSGQMLLTLKGHMAPVTAVAFTRDGRQLISGDSDGFVRLWDGRGLVDGSGR